MTYINTSFPFSREGTQFGDDRTTFSYSCAQSRSRAECEKEDKKRASRRMERFDCEGWLHITTRRDRRRVVRVKLKHAEKHIPYLDIELPDHWKEYIRENLDQTPGNVCNCF